MWDNLMALGTLERCHPFTSFERVEGKSRFYLREPSRAARAERPSGQAAERPLSKWPKQAARAKRLELAAQRPKPAVGASGPSDHIKMEASKDLTDNL